MTMRRALALGCVLAAALAHAHAAAPASPRNLTTGGPLKAGHYGRIDPRGSTPPVIYTQPVIASQAWVRPGVKPVYLYVPPGQVRRWGEHCMKWKACDEPVLFVRMEDSPSRLGSWKQRPPPGTAPGAPVWLSWLLPPPPAPAPGF
jgi:hypothetical protein